MTEVEAYNRIGHPVDVSGGRVVAPGQRVTVDDEDAHDAALITDGTLAVVPNVAPAPEADDGTSDDEADAPAEDPPAPPKATRTRKRRGASTAADNTTSEDTTP